MRRQTWSEATPRMEDARRKSWPNRNTSSRNYRVNASQSVRVMTATLKLRFEGAPGLPPQGGRTAPDPSSFRKELGWILRIGGPLAAGELGWMSTYIVDALMIGRLPHSALSIAASSLGNTIYYAFAFFMVYLLNGLETFIAQAYGRGDHQECVRMLAQSMWIVLVGTPITMLLTMGSVWLLPYFGTPPEIVAETHRYLSALVWSTAPLLLYMALRRYLQSTTRVLLISVSLITASIVNFTGDWAFLFGHLGIHAMGIAGSGWATCLVRLWMLALLLVGTVKSFRATSQRPTLDLLWPDWPRLRGLLRIGWPSGLDYSADLSVSTFMSILCARLGSTLLAAHQVTLDLSAFVYMVPQGLSYAAMIRVGQGAGRNDLPQVRRATSANLLISIGFTAVAGVVFAAFARMWAAMYTNDSYVVLAAAPIFAISGFALCADAIAVTLSAALTGLGDTRTPLAVNLSANWLLGMPLAYLLVRHGHSLAGLWVGRAVGSIGAAIALFGIWQWKMSRATQQQREHRLHLFTPLVAK